MDDFLHCHNYSLMSAGDWIKHSDCSWGQNDEFPALSLTVETGLMESDTNLASDAAGWLESDGNTNDIVLAVSIHEGIPKFVIKKILYLKGDAFGGIDHPGGNCAILAVLSVL